MEITSKIVYVKKKSTFESLISTIPKNLNPLVFIEDTKEAWICGTYFSVGYPEVIVTEDSGSVNISFGNSSFYISTSGDGISVRKGTDNRVIITSSALTRINAVSPLKWNDQTKQLTHLESGVTPGSYGPTSDSDKASVITSTNIIVDKYGHITSLENKNITIRDYVEQLEAGDTNADRNILLSYNPVNNYSDTAPVRKANGLTFNDNTKLLSVQGSIYAKSGVTVDSGDITINSGYFVGKLKGDVEGSAVPKIHLSSKPEYGGASTELYGHVTLKDDLPTEKPDPSSSNTNTGDPNVKAVAASPLMVWNSVESTKEYVQDYINQHGINIKGTDSQGEIVELNTGFTFSKDFTVDNNEVQLRWIEL